MPMSDYNDRRAAELADELVSAVIDMENARQEFEYKTERVRRIRAELEQLKKLDDREARQS